MGWYSRLKEKWGKTNLEVFLILVAFSINGSFAVWVAKPLLAFLGIDKELMSWYVYYPLRILIIFPIYQLTLPISGFIVGQFKFFWAFEKKMWGRMIGKKS